MASGSASPDDGQSTRLTEATPSISPLVAMAEEERREMFRNAPLVISVDNVHKTYLIGVEGVAALRGVSATVKKGEVCFSAVSKCLWL